jgi:hypothetical protein
MKTSLNILFSGVRGRYVEMGRTNEGRCDEARNISEKNSIGISSKIPMLLALRTEGATLPSMKPKLSKATIHNPMAATTEKNEPMMVTSKNATPTTKRTTREQEMITRRDITSAMMKWMLFKGVSFNRLKIPSSRYVATLIVMDKSDAEKRIRPTIPGKKKVAGENIPPFGYSTG